MSSKGGSAVASVAGKIRLTINTGQASPGPPIGPALGQRGIKAMDFCKQFNERSSKLFAPNLPLRCLLRVKPDKSFDFEIKPPSTAFLLRRAAGVDRLSTKYTMANVSVKVFYELAKQKQATDPRMKNLSLEAVLSMIVGQARKCGINIIK